MVIQPFQGFRDLVCTIAGIRTLIAETGADMSRFPTAKHLTSWPGTTTVPLSRLGRCRVPGLMDTLILQKDVTRYSQMMTHVSRNMACDLGECGTRRLGSCDSRPRGPVRSWLSRCWGR